MYGSSGRRNSICRLKRNPLLFHLPFASSTQAAKRRHGKQTETIPLLPRAQLPHPTCEIAPPVPSNSKKKPLPLAGLCNLSAHPILQHTDGLRNERECASRYQVSHDFLKLAVPLHHLSNILHSCIYALFCSGYISGPSASPSAGRSSEFHVMSRPSVGS